MTDLYRYHLEGHSLSVPGRVIRLTVTAASADDARRMAAIRCPDFGPTTRSPKRRARVEPVEPDGMDLAKAREFVEWRGAPVEVTG